MTLNADVRRGAVRRLIAALLMLPLIAGGSLRVDASAHGRSPLSPVSETVFAEAVPLVQHALPGHAALHGLTTSLVLAGPAGVDAWRNPGAQRAGTHPARSHGHTADARTRIGSVQRARLAFARTMARAHANLPGTFGNPPPPLLT